MYCRLIAKLPDRPASCGEWRRRQRCGLERPNGTDFCHRDVAIGHCGTLIESRADPNAKDQRGNTPLTLAIVAGGSPELVKLLLKYGADPNLKGTNERSPVLNADKRGSDEIVSILREAGAKGW